MEAMRTVTIVGGGLAGLSLGVALSSRKIPVELFEAGRLPRHRVCGEFICGVKDNTLQTLGIKEDMDDAHQHREVYWESPYFNGGQYSRLPYPAYGISRYTLDGRLLASQQKQGARVTMNRWRGNEEDEGLILATGRKATRSSWMGFKLHLAGFEAKADLEMHLGKGGYAGICAVEDGWYNLCGLFRKREDIRKNKEEILFAYLDACGLQNLRERCEGLTVREDSCCGVAGVAFGEVMADPAACCLGDAWAVMPPFTGNGMSMALESAAVSVSPLQAWAEGKQNWPTTRQQIRAAHKQSFSKRLAWARRLHPWMEIPSRQRLLLTMAHFRLLPFGWLFRLTH